MADYPGLHFVFPQLTPYYGMELAAYHVLSALHDHGFAVSATVISGEVPEPFEAFDVVSLAGSRRITRLVESIPRLGAVLRGRPEDVIIGSGLWASVPLTVSLVGRPNPFIHWEHSLLEPRLYLDQRLKLLANSMKFAPKTPDLVVGVSEAVRIASIERYPRIPRAEMIPNVVIEPNSNLSNCEPESRTDGSIDLFTTGALRPYKNYSAAITSLLFLPENYRLTLAGDGPQREKLERLVAKYKLQRRVEFLGRISDVSGRLKRANVLVHPSLAETFGFSLIEASQLEVPVVNIPAPAMGELMPHAVPGETARTQSPEHLARAILSVVESPPTAEDFRCAREERIARFSPRVVGARWAEVLHEFINEV